MHMYLKTSARAEFKTTKEVRGPVMNRRETVVTKLLGYEVYDSPSDPFLLHSGESVRVPPEILSHVDYCTVREGFNQTVRRVIGIYEMDGAVGKLDSGGGSHYTFEGKTTGPADPEKLYALLNAIREGSIVPTHSFEEYQIPVPPAKWLEMLEERDKRIGELESAMNDLEAKTKEFAALAEALRNMPPPLSVRIAEFFKKAFNRLATKFH